MEAGGGGQRRGQAGRGRGEGQVQAGRSYGKSRTVDRGKVGSASQGWEKTKRASKRIVTAAFSVGWVRLKKKR